MGRIQDALPGEGRLGQRPSKRTRWAHGIGDPTVFDHRLTGWCLADLSLH